MPMTRASAVIRVTDSVVVATGMAVVGGSVFSGRSAGYSSGRIAVAEEDGATERQRKLAKGRRLFLRRSVPSSHRHSVGCMTFSLQQLIQDLVRAGHVVRLEDEIDARLEAAEIQRRVYARGGPAVLFANVKGCCFPMV